MEGRRTAEEKTVPLHDLIGWKKNPKTMVKKADFERLKAQILELGLYKRLVCCREGGKYIVLGGNQRLRALQDLGALSAGISIVKAPTDAEKLKYALSDNDNVAGWDDQNLAELLFEAKDKIKTEIFKIELGKPISVDNLLSQFGPNRFDQTREDIVPPAEKKSETRPGDLFTAGKHRILCGDATKEWAYAALMGDKKADLVFTDPPYNVKYEGTKYGPIAGDNVSEERFIEFSLAFMARMKDHTKAGGVFYICSGYSSYPAFIYAIKATGMTFSTPIIWIKNASSLGWSDYHHKHEMLLKAQASKRKQAVPILYGWKGGKHYFLDIRDEADVWEIARRGSSTMLHPTQKPLALVQRAIRNSSRPGETILDPFGGSGSTLVAAEREGLDLRIARARQTPLEQWEKTGWPMLGKTAARLWNQRHTGLGFRLNVSECCRAMKIGPARAVARNLGCTLQFTGQRGQADDNLRGMRTIKDGSLFFQERDKLWICNPLTGWTDADIAAYIKAHPIVRHPAMALGAQTIGCVFCGGGSQYTNSGYRFLRHIWPEAWRQFMIDWRGGEIILALKYKTSLNRIQAAIAAAGGLKGLAAERPWIFDFTRLTPIKGYRK